MKETPKKVFPANIAKSLRAAILNIICERLLLPFPIFCKDSVDISYENASFGILQKQPSRGVLRKRFSENMKQIYRRTPMPKYDFNKVAKQLYLNRTSTWVFSCTFAAYFQNTLSQEHLWMAASDTRRLCVDATYLFLNFNFILAYETYLFRIDGDNVRVLAKKLTLCSIYRSNQPSWKIHGIA